MHGLFYKSNFPLRRSLRCLCPLISLLHLQKEDKMFKQKGLATGFISRKLSFIALILCANLI